MTSLVDATARETHVEISLDNGKQMNFPYAYLRDNCPSNFHPSTLQRLTPMNRDILASRAASVSILEHGVLLIEWANVVRIDASRTLDSVSRFPLQWLLDHSLVEVSTLAIFARFLSLSLYHHIDSC